MPTEQFFSIDKDGIKFGVNVDGSYSHSYTMDEMEKYGITLDVEESRDANEEWVVKMDYEYLIETGMSPLYHEIMMTRHLIETGILIAPQYMGDEIGDLFRAQSHLMELRFQIFEKNGIFGRYSDLARGYHALKKTINFILKTENLYANTEDRGGVL